MLGRIALVSVVAGSIAGVLASTAAAGTWAGAASDPRIGFQVYRPTHELGMHASVARVPCIGGPTGPYAIAAGYRRRGSKARAAIYESSPQRCGDPGESLPVKRVMVRGRSVQVNVFCHRPGCRGGATLAGGFRYGFLLFVPQPGRHGAAPTDIEITTTHLRLGAVLRLARSLTPITRPKGPWPAVHVPDFLSPDGKIWCLMDDGSFADRAWCVTLKPEHSGQVDRDGSVHVCTAAGPPDVCTQNWGTDSPRLEPGQSSRIGPYRCTAGAASMTCTVTSGPGTGHGFTIDAAGVTTIEPAQAASRPVYFFASPFGLLSDTTLVIRPRGFPIFLDGQWVLERLRWKHWGAKVARATGISSSSDDDPDAASGKRIKTRARVTLSNRGRFQGHTVYRCVKVTVPPPADFGPRRCIKGKGKFAFFG